MLHYPRHIDYRTLVSLPNKQSHHLPSHSAIVALYCEVHACREITTSSTEGVRFEDLPAAWHAKMPLRRNRIVSVLPVSFWV